MTWKNWENYMPPSALKGTVSDNLLRVRQETPPAKRGKYGAVKTTVDGITFDSKKEAARYQELKMLEQAGEIQDLRRQPSFDLNATFWMMGGESMEIKVGTYVADFQYIERESQSVVVEDVKGMKTPLYRWKKKHLEAQYGITIRET